MKNPLLITGLKVITFLIFYFAVGNLIIYKVIWPMIDALPPKVHAELEPYLALDFGRVVERVFRFFWTLLLFFTAERLMNGKTFKDTVLFNTNYKFWTLLRGGFFGAVLMTGLIVLTVSTGTVEVVGIKIHVATFISTLILYAICMGLTAVYTELALRGFVLSTLMKQLGTHQAIWISAFLFSIVDLTVSPYAAYTTFVLNILLGYSFAWHGIYYCIGWHFAWTYLEAVFYSGNTIHYHVMDPFLAGQKAISPDQEGLLMLPILLIGFALILTTHKTEWRHGDTDQPLEK